MEIDSDGIGCAFGLVGLASIALLFVDLRYAFIGAVMAAVLFFVARKRGDTELVEGGCAPWLIGFASIALLFIDLRYALAGGITTAVLALYTVILGRVENARQRRRELEQGQKKEREEELRKEAAVRKRERENILAVELNFEIVEQIRAYVSSKTDVVAEVSRGSMAHGISVPQHLTGRAIMGGSITHMLFVLTKANGKVTDGLARLFYAALAQIEPSETFGVEACKQVLQRKCEEGYKFQLPPDLPALAFYDQTEGTKTAGEAANIYQAILLKAVSSCDGSYAVRMINTAYVEALRPYLPDGAALHRHGAGEVSVGKRKGLDAVAGMTELKQALNDEVIQVFQNPEQYRRYGISIPNGVLLFGPPGCGKTYIARQLASELAYHFIEISPSDLGSSYLHGTSLKIRRTFDEAVQKAPCVLFLDEFDALVPSRAQMGDGHQYRAEEVNEFLARMSTCAENRILLIAATNRPWEIDDAVQRAGRLDKKIYVAPPDSAARLDILNYHLSGRYTAADLNVESIAPELSGYASSDLKLLVDEAAKAALKESEPITERHLVAARKLVPPSISSEQELEYRRFGTRGVEVSPTSSPKLGFSN